MPQSGVRVLIASDGVWDAFEKMLRVCRMARSWTIEVPGASQSQSSVTDVNETLTLTPKKSPHKKSCP